MKSFNVLKFALLFVVQASACFSQNAQLRWDTQLDRPVDHPLIIYKGETLDLFPRLVQGTDPVTITNTSLYFRYREPALVASNLYREVAISTNEAAGTLHMEWTPALDVGSTSYDYEFVVGGNPRVHGRITMRGTISYPGSTNAPAPSTRWMTDLDLAAATASLAKTGDLASVASDLQSTGNSLAAAILAGDAAVVTFAQTNRYITQPEVVTSSVPAYVVTEANWTAGGLVALGDVYTYLNTVVQFVDYDPGPDTIQTNIYYSGPDNHYMSYVYDAYWDYDQTGLGSWVIYDGLGTGYGQPGITGLGDYEKTEEAPVIEFGSGNFEEFFLLSRTNIVTVSTVTNLIPIASESYVDAAVAAIPLPPTNLISGWLLYDVGSNTYNTVIMSNGFLSVWEVVQ